MLNEKTYEQEQNEIIENLIFNDIYPLLGKSTENHGINLEFFITSTCNKKCEYCYLQKHEDILYPKELRNPDTILKNLRIYLEHLIVKKVHIARLDFFTGEIWESQFGRDILLTVLEYLKKGLRMRHIMIPTNGSFINNPKDVEFYEKMIEEYKKVNVQINFSLSDDGLYLDELNRPYTNSNRSDIENFYNKIFEFCKKYEYAFHPMIAANGIEHQINSIHWWEQQFKKYNLSLGKDIMFLEVRNDDWTDEKILSYLEWLKEFSDIVFNSEECFNKDVFNFTSQLTYTYDRSKRKCFFNTYSPILLGRGPRANCGITQSLCVRLGDLAICPCHRTAYPKLIYGYYQVEDDKITGIKCNNYYFALINYVGSQYCYLKCDACPINWYCPKGCLGAQLEKSYDPLFPIESVCRLEIAKTLFNSFNFLYYFNKLKEEEINQDFIKRAQEVKVLINTIKNNYPEDYNKWSSKIETLLIKP